MKPCLPIYQQIILLFSLMASHSLSAEQQGYPAIPLLSTERSIVGEKLVYPNTGQAHVTAAIVTIAAGEKTILHQHGVPLFAYVLDGTLRVNYGEQGTRVYQQGDSFMEAMSVAHYGENTTHAPVRILAVYMGAAGADNVIKMPQ